MSAAWQWEHFCLDYDGDEDCKDLSATSAGFRRLMADLAWQHLHELAELQKELSLHQRSTRSAMEECLAAKRERDDVLWRLEQLESSNGVMDESRTVLMKAQHPPPPAAVPPEPAVVEPPEEVDISVSFAPDTFQGSPRIGPSKDSHRHTTVRAEREARQELKAELEAIKEMEMAEGETASADRSCMGTLKGWITSTAFEAIIGCLILVNVLVIAFELQYEGFDTGYLIGYPDMTQPAHLVWPGGEVTFRIVEAVFTSMFTLEMMLRIAVLRWEFFKVKLNIVEALVVLSSLVEVIYAELMNTMVLRLLRLTKLTRSMRLMNISNILDALRMIMRCLTASVGTLFWSLFVLLVIQCIGAMLVMYSVTRYMQDESVDVNKRIMVFRYYGTFTRTMLTMFEVLFANWIPPCRLLVDEVSEWYAAVFILYRCLVGFAVLNVVNAVFIQRTMKVAQDDREFQIMQKQKAAESFSRKIQHIFQELDSSGDGLLTWDEFKQKIEDQRISALLTSMEVDTQDMFTLFQLLDNGDGQIEPEEFSHGILQMKGAAKSLDVAQILKISKRLEKMLVNMNSAGTGEKRRSTKTAA